MRVLTLILVATLMGCASNSQDVLTPMEGESRLAPGQLAVEILSPTLSPTEAIYATDGEVLIDVEGAASTIGGVRYLDMMLVMDTSMSLTRTDPEDYRSAGAIEFVQNLSAKSDVQIGLVTFDSNSELRQSLTTDRASIVAALSSTKRSGGTNIAAGIHTALEELRSHGRPDSSRVLMLFTDGKSNQHKVREATRLAQQQGVTVQTLLLGDDKKGAAILQEVALGTGGGFVQITDPSQLTEAFLNMRTTGVEAVMLSVNGGPEVPTRLTGGTFTGQLPLQLGENLIKARAVSLDEQSRTTELTLMVQDASCAALAVNARRNAQPALSLNEHAVEIVLDSSRSMWGQIAGESKMNIARHTLLKAADWLPRDMDLALRAYGNESPSDANNCADSSLLVPFGGESREAVRKAVETLRPRGQTPIAFALQQAAQDFGAQERERTIVLVTDGIESCDGDPVAAAAELLNQGITTHIIGFGMGQGADEDARSLRAIAQAGGGRYVSANNAEELQSALEQSVGTRYGVYRAGELIARSNLGSNKPLFLPKGDYQVRLESKPPRELEVSLEPRDELTVTMASDDGEFSSAQTRGQMEPMSCDEAIALAEGADNNLAYMDQL